MEDQKHSEAAPDEGPMFDSVVRPFALRHPAPRLQSLSSAQMSRLLWLVDNQERLETVLKMADKLVSADGCPVARHILISQ